MSEGKIKLLTDPLKFDQFKQNVSVKENGNGFGTYRVTTINDLEHWFFDCLIDTKKSARSETEAIECAFEYLTELRARSGQINLHSIYVSGVEEIDCLPAKRANHATVYIVRDRVDLMWRSSYHYWLVLTGNCSGISFKRADRFKDKQKAIIAGAKALHKSLTQNNECKTNKELKDLVKKIESFISSKEDEVLQPSLFQF